VLAKVDGAGTTPAGSAQFDKPGDESDRPGGVLPG